MEKIAIYGLSTETDKAIPKLQEEYEIVGLIDGFRIDGEMYDYPIIPIESAIEKGISRIIVIARPGSCKAIEKRIGNICRENDIELMDIRGRDLLQPNKVVYNFKGVKGYKKSEIINEIKNNDVISFDLFDTLIMRNVPYATDVIELVNIELIKKGYVIEDFINKRIAAEKKMSQGYAPRLSEIYREILGGDYAEFVEEFVNIEFNVDLNLICPRKESNSLIMESKKLEKRVYITTDSYYSKEQIEKILLLNNIEGYDDIFVSCEYGKSKNDGLYVELIKESETKEILHIGDDEISDIKAAERYGLVSFRLYSAFELFDFVGGLGFEELVCCLADRIKIGIFLAQFFNNPFQFENEEKKIFVNNTGEIGFLFCAPIISDFLVWYEEKVKEKKCMNVWFGARDGYLIQKLYHKFYPEQQTEYFLTSRISAIRAGVENTEDIKYVDSMKFSGDLTCNLKCRFGIDALEISKEDTIPSESGLLKYSSEILNKATIKKQNNIKYVQKLNVKNGNIAFFDFVAKGTTQLYVQRLIDNHMIGLYFFQLEPDFEENKNLEIYSFYTGEERNNSAIFDDYYILEAILTSPNPSVDEFDFDGNPIYSLETRSEKDISCFMQAQNGIMKYVDTFLNICPRSEIKINKELDEKFLMLIHNVEIRDSNFLKLIVEDPFFNRMTDITDVL